MQEALLAWFDRHRRDLPWRRTRDPYAIWVSEVMLQQTQVATVIPYYERFLARFPTVAALARARLSDVLGSWRGLGYYARARALHRAAAEIARRGAMPRTAEALRELPGFGRYTAGAVASIAFGERAPVLDGNVARVLARYAAIEDDIRAPNVRERLWALADRLVPADRPGDFNQALMELGALICTPRGPTCLLCPVSATCEARKRGLVDRIPAPRKVRARIALSLASALVRRGERVLLARRAERGLFGGLWELPTATEDGASPSLARTLKADLGVGVIVGPLIAEIERTLTHRDLRVRVYACEAAGGRLRPRGTYIEAAFKRRDELESLGMATAMSAALSAALDRATGRVDTKRRPTRRRGGTPGPGARPGS